MIEKSLHLLLIEAKKQTRQLIEKTLVEAGLVHQISWVNQLDTTFDQLNYNQIDVVLLSHGLPGSDSLALLQQIQTQNEHLPIIFMADAGDETVVSQALALGAHTYIIKDRRGAYLNLLPSVVQNAQRFEKAERRVEQIESLYQISQSLTALRDQKSLLNHIVEQAVHFFRGEAGGIYLYRPEQEVIEWVAGIGARKEEARSLTLTKNEGFAGAVWATGQPLFVDDYQRWSGWTPKWPYPRVLVGVPIQWEHEFLGVLDIRLADTQSTFGDKDFSLLLQFATQAAIAIQNARLFEETQRRAEQLAVLHQASLKLTSVLELCPVLETILESVLKLLPKTHCAQIFLYENDTLTFGAAWANGYRAQAVSPPRPNGLTYTVARRGEALIISDMQSHPLYASLPPTSDWQGSIMGLPLKIGERVIGVLKIHYPQSRMWPEIELQMLHLLADQAAITIENTRLYQQQHTHRREAQALHRTALALASTIDLDEVIQRILTELQTVVSYDSASVQLSGENYTEIIGCRGFPDSSKIIGYRFDLSQNKNPLNKQVIETKKPVIIDDTSMCRDQFDREPHNIIDTNSWLAVPMQVGEQTVGMITLDKRQPYFYTRQHAHLASAYAAQAAIAIQNAQLHQSTTDSLAQLTRLYELSAEFVSTLSLDEVANLVIEKTVQATNAHSAVLNLIDTSGKLQLAIGAGDEPTPRPNGTTMAIFKSGQALVINDGLSPTQNFPPHLAQKGIKASIGLPLKAGEDTIGVLFVRHDRPHHFSPQEVEILFIFANQAAIAVQNARLYEQAQQEIQERKRIEAALNRYQHRLEELVQQRTVQLERAMAEIAEAKDKIDVILHSVADGLIVTDLNHKVVLANSAAETLLDYRLETMMNRELDTAIKNDWLRQLVHSTLTHRIAVSEVDFKLNSGSGQTKIMHARAALVQDNQGKPFGTVTIIRDVTRLREVDRLKTEFLSIAAHELRTPLTTVLGFSEILLSRELEASRRQRYLTLINEQASQLAEIVNSLLDISRLEAGKGLELKIQPVDMGQLLNEVTRPFIETFSKHHFLMEGLTPLPFVKGDRFRLGQVAKNLISNAVKYSPQGGAITIRGTVNVDHIQFSIQDEGIGMTPEQQRHLFEKFYRADASNTAIGGTGLGLAISKLIIDLHQGTMWVNSQREIGTTVYFTLPLAKTGQD